MWIIGSMKTLLETGEPFPPASSATPDRSDTSGGDAQPADGPVHIDGEDHRRLAIDANNSIWGCSTATTAPMKTTRISFAGRTPPPTTGPAQSAGDRRTRRGRST